MPRFSASWKFGRGHYVVDLIDLEEVPPALSQPAGTLSVSSYGATGNGSTDDGQAIQNAINDAQAQGKNVWIPPGTYLDASAVLAVIFAEKGANAVIPRLPGALLSCVNLAEVTSRALESGKPLEDTISEIARLPLRLVDYDPGHAHITASLRPVTKSLGLSLGDRACLALGLARLRRLAVARAARRRSKLSPTI